MSVPPSYGDLGKSARDLFGKGFNYGYHQLEVNSKTKNGVEFKTSGSSNHESGKVNGSLETKYKWRDYGLTFEEKWNTENVLSTSVSIEDQITKGLKLSFDTNFAPQTGKKSGKVKAAFKQDHLNLSSDVSLDPVGPQVNCVGVLGYNGWLAGCQCSYDTAKSKLTKNNFAVGYNGGDFILHTSVNDGNEFGGSVYHQVNDSLSTGMQLNWTAGSNATRFGAAAKYALDRDTTLRLKVNNSLQVGCAYQQNIRDGVTLTVSSLVEGRSFNAGGHKVGMGLEFDF